MNWHGTLSGYTNHGCRCGDCRSAWNAYQREYRLRLVERPVPDDAHGRYTTYLSWSCRCDDCRAAWAAYGRQRRQRNRPHKFASEGTT